MKLMGERSSFLIRRAFYSLKAANSQSRIINRLGPGDAFGERVHIIIIFCTTILILIIIKLFDYLIIVFHCLCDVL